MNKLDLDYQALLSDILENGYRKGDRTGTGTISVFGRQIRHKMSDGFPLLTTKKMYYKGIITELIWFLRGDSNIKYLIDNNCNIWNGDAYKKYCNDKDTVGPLTMKQFVEEIKTDDNFADKWGELGPTYGKQWRQWQGCIKLKNGSIDYIWYDQIRILINNLKTNPNSRRLMVSSWNVAEVDNMTLPPCHYTFQCYTRELSTEERNTWYFTNRCGGNTIIEHDWKDFELDQQNIPLYELSLSWNQRSVDTFLGLPFNIASYGLLLEILAKECNMVSGELIGNLGDTHLYSNHVEQAKEQIGRKFTSQERIDMLQSTGMDALIDGVRQDYMEKYIPKRTREPFDLPLLKINAPIGRIDFFEWIKTANANEFEIIGYEAWEKIVAPLSN